jgi:hypothetical protein
VIKLRVLHLVTLITPLMGAIKKAGDTKWQSIW